MDPDSVFLVFEIAAALLLAILNAILVAMFIYAYVRSRQFCFVLLCAGSFVFGLSMFYTVAICYVALTHTQLIPQSLMRVAAWIYILVTPVAGVVSFIGSVLLLRFVLPLYKNKDLTMRLS